MAKKKRKSKGNVVSVDFAGVEAGGGGSKVKPGEYVAEVVEVTQEEGNDSGQPYLKWQFKITEGKYKGSTLYHNTSLQHQALFNLRSLLEAMQVEVPDSEMDLDLEEYAGMSVGVVVEREKYNGKNQARCVGFFNPEDGASGADDEDEDEDEDEDSADTDDADDETEDDDDEDEDADSDDDDEDEDEDKEDEDDEDEDEDEDEKPRGKKSKTSKKTGKKKRR